MECHWTEQSRNVSRRVLLTRVFGLFHVVAGALYFIYRFRETIGTFDKSVSLVAYQFFFYGLEVAGYVLTFFRLLEVWNNVRRNCIDLKDIPLGYIDDNFVRDMPLCTGAVESKYPTVGVFIPCYNEDVYLVEETILSSLKMDYPKQLLSVYLCDDGKDPAKVSMVSRIQMSHANLHYCTRPEHTHAKAGNLNYTLQRTESDLVVIFDADFVARPNFLQRLVPYFFVWNPDLGLYEFNQTLAAVQTPQQYRNLSPHDSDPFDQRYTDLSEVVLPGKDWFNACPLTGTANISSREALKKAGYFPYKSVTEDVAMAIALHSMGYRTYYVCEPLAHGLATDSLWSNYKQRERWLKGEWQIFFSSSNPLLVNGLTFAQRILYLSMSFNQFMMIVYLMIDLASIALLAFGIRMLDVDNIPRFFAFYGLFWGSGLIWRAMRTSGKTGLEKSESARAVFGVIFRFVAVKGLFEAVTNRKGIKFDVTEKPSLEQGSFSNADRWRDVRKNLQKIWINIAWIILLGASLVRGVSMRSAAEAADDLSFQSLRNLVPLTMTVTFGVCNIIPHCLVAYVCFVPYLSGWLMKDFVHGRCDQYAVDLKGKQFIPRSYISLVYWSQVLLSFIAILVQLAVEKAQ